MFEIKINKIKESRRASVDFNNLSFGKHFSDHIFIADYENGTWQNARIQPFETFTVSPAAMALHYGQSIFEGMKAHKNKKNEVILFRPDANAKRFNISAQRMCMPEIPNELFLSGLKMLLDLDRDWIPSQEGCFLYIRPFMFASEEHMGVRPSEKYKFVILMTPSGVYYNKPLSLKVETEFARSCPGGVGFAKAAGNYGGALLPTLKAKQEGFDQVIWTDAYTHKYIEESGTMNIMFLINNKLITPSTDRDTILKGITRDSVLKLARNWGIEAEERLVSVEEVIAALQNGTLKEAFGVGTAVGLSPVEKITYKDKTYILPVISKSDSFVFKTTDFINGLREGTVEDTFNWIQKV